MMARLRVELGRRSYNIIISKGVLGEFGSFMQEKITGNKTLLVTNKTVSSLYGDRVTNSLEAAGFKVVTAVIGEGEEYKNLTTAEKLYDMAFNHELDRQCPIIALGGGVVGDITGFVASTYLRGVPFIQAPTTLLAQVDSSVGGKVAVNHPRGKNIIGAFYQPALVLADTETLDTLPAREVRSGLAEVIKYGAIDGEDFLDWLEERIEDLFGLDGDALAQAVAVSCRIKARVVAEDETEQGRRAILNFGHTVGHAIEALTGYTRFTHGEAVGIGMVAASQLAVNLRLLPSGEAMRLAKLIKRAGLPTEIPPGLSTDALLESIRRDKKVLDGKLTFVLPVAAGRVEIVRDVPEEAVREVL